jgi:hypothetical protein
LRPRLSQGNAAIMARSLRVPALVLTVLLWGCGGDAEQQNEVCTYGQWEACPRPSLEARSKPWAELRLRLGELAEAVEQATGAPDPTHWRLTVTGIEEPADWREANDPDWPGPVSQEDYRRRGEPLLEWKGRLSLLKGELSNYSISPSPLITESVIRSAKEARDAFAVLGSAGMFQDPFGQPEPRLALFAYAHAATVMQFLAASLVERRDIAARGARVLEERLGDWETMQRERLKRRPDAELQAAIDEIGGTEIGRLVEAWRAIENLDLEPFVSE